MSNPAVGAVYNQIIEEVIGSSRVDFEESGVDESVLEALRKGWQNKLSLLQVAQFPWDPKPEPLPPSGPSSSNLDIPDGGPAGSGNYSQQQLSPHIPAPGSLDLSHVANGQQHVKTEPVAKLEPEIKTEPGLDNIPMPPNYAGPNHENAAALRASQALQDRYGQRAAGSINAIQQGLPTGAAAAASRAPMQPQQPPGHAANNHAYRQQAGKAAQAQSARPKPAQPSVGNAQTDGADDAVDGFDGVLMRRNEAGDMVEMGRLDIDRMIHDQILARAKSMEGGGLMLPLREATRHSGVSRKRKNREAGQFDGLDEDEDDVDAINSDLDDTDEERDDSEIDDGGLNHIMLCMYDKVQRVKNKWKCILKDGVLTVNGKDYVFHKATGEYEW